MGAEPQNDIVIIGCGPVALFSVFQLGLFGFRCHLIDASDRPGGQCAALYADKLEARTAVIASGLGAFGLDGQVIRPDPLAEVSLIKTGNMLAVSPETFRTSSSKVYAIGDACHYPGKLKLILSGFHEAALMKQAIRRELR